MSSKKETDSAAAFTLLEVLIAITIFAITVSLVYSLYSSTISIVHNVEERVELNDRYRLVSEQVSNDLTALYRGESGYLNARDVTSTNNDESFLQFTSTAHLIFNPETPPRAVSAIGYFLEPEDEEQLYTLSRFDSRHTAASDDEPVAEQRRLILCEGLKELKVSYMDRQGQTFSEWNSQSEEFADLEDDQRFPASITLTFVFPSKEDDERTDEYSVSIYLRPALMKFSEESGSG